MAGGEQPSQWGVRNDGAISRRSEILGTTGPRSVGPLQHSFIDESTFADRPERGQADSTALEGELGSAGMPTELVVRGPRGCAARDRGPNDAFRD